LRTDRAFAMRLTQIRFKISVKIFCAFVAMALMMGALGAYGIYVLSAAGDIVADTYDRPLMAINYARSANTTFIEMEKELFRRKGVAVAEQAAIDARLASLATSFDGDLKVAEERSQRGEARDIIDGIGDALQRWNALRLRGDDAASDALGGLSTKIAQDFDRLIEMTADQSFVERRQGISAIDAFKARSIAAAALALLVAVAITLLLARRIIRPLSTAARIADRIAGGELTTPIPDGGKDETGALLRSMTVMQDSIRVMMERETAQRRSAQTRLIDALESSREGMMLVDPAGRIVIANSQMASFFPGVARYLVEGTEATGVFALIRRQVAQHADTAPQGMSDLSKILDHGEFQLADGRWIRVSRSSTQDGGYFLFLSDFSDVKERERRTREAQEAAEAASRAKSSFLANMSHELRTPLNAIIGFSEIMAGQMFGALGNTDYVGYSADILQSGRHLLDIINGVLDLAKSETGKLQINPETVDLKEILVDCGAMMRQQCTRQGLRLDFAPGDAPVLVLGEPAKLRQIFLNLLSNSVKFTEPGGAIALAIATDVNGVIAVSVADTGIGMSSAEIPIALSPFGQVDNRLARRYEGTGLGLPLAKALVELHGGAVAIASTPGKGTTVTVTLPPALDTGTRCEPLLRAAG
jgi:signal transduction histidine kinase/HAMP domain-containing protein